MQLLFFLKFTQCVTILHTVSNQEVIPKRLISMLRIAQKLYVRCKVIYVGCINSSYNNVAKCICLLDKKAFFCLHRKFSCKVRAFERHIPLSSEDKVSLVKLDAKFVNSLNSLYERECHFFLKNRIIPLPWYVFSQAHRGLRVGFLLLWYSVVHY